MRKITRICKGCGSKYYGSKGKVYCSEDCRNTVSHIPWNRGKRGLPANRPRNGETKPCLCCGNLFYVSACRLLTAHYCSRTCYLKTRWDETHQETRICVVCNTPFHVFTSAHQVTCLELTCQREQRSRLHRGENSQFWRGGKTSPYNGEWRSIRRQVYERDGYKCVLCDGIDRIQCHHIIPYRYSHSHALENLITLCRSCHSSEEIKVNAVYVDTLFCGNCPSIKKGIVALDKTPS